MNDIMLAKTSLFQARLSAAHQLADGYRNGEEYNQRQQILTMGHHKGELGLGEVVV